MALAFVALTAASLRAKIREAEFIEMFFGVAFVVGAPQRGGNKDSSFEGHNNLLCDTKYFILGRVRTGPGTGYDQVSP